ncbi:restriction endonuclease subunit S [Flavobacterium amniphilum]|uniref:restriction endonuclease subunit S n=1 Tax=Flavobacterium amniphilum TaxID=1834035 RepID=UPI00202A91E2|nr:restriction endonuclease subunit S [Flavobacterium amniphilum]MCL9807042.1 restriction endonuclease subunit S [Flavobacterium amniphilum]
MENTLPKNWVETELNQIISYVIGGDWGKDTDFIDTDFVEVICIRGSEIKNWSRDKGKTASLRKIKKSSLSNRQLIKGDILLEISGGGPDQPVGRTVLIDGDVLNFETHLPKVCTNFLRLVRIYENINSKLINHYLQYFYNSGEITKYQGGSNNLRNLKYKDYETISIPLPPLAEQNRIVEKLDTLFAQLETIKTSMAKVPELLKNFRQQVLEKEYKINAEKIELNDVCLKIQDGAHHSPKVTYETQLENTFLYITSKNIRNNYMKLDNVQYVDFEFHNTIYPRCTPEIGDVLLTKDGANTGNVTLNELDVPFSLLSSVCLIKTNKEKLIPAYLKYYFQSNDGFNELIGEMTGTAIKRIVLKKIKATKIPLPATNKQQEIVSRVESLFAKADAIEKQYESLKAKIDTLPQAILHKAFKGELTQQLDSDGDARELLREINELKNSRSIQIKNNIKGKSIPKKQKNDRNKHLVDSIKKILKEKATGISYKELITKLYDSNEEDLINDIIQQLLINNIISQEFNIEQKQMLIKINQ